MFKKHSILIFCLLLLLISVVVFARINNAGSVKGTIVDNSTGHPIKAGVHVFSKEAKIGAGSDLEGNFSLMNLPPGEYDISFSSPEYDTKVIKDVSVNFARTTRMKVKLARKSQYRDIAALAK